MTKSKIDAPSYGELLCMILTGVLHVTIELTWGGIKDPTAIAGWPERIYNVSVAGLWACYVLWRVIKTPGLAHAWGFRWGNFLEASLPSILFSSLAVMLLLIYGGGMGRLPVPTTFWLVLMLYPLYGIAQQFALQVLVGKNLRGIVTQRVLRTLVVASIFSLAHFPKYNLMSLVFPAGLAFTWIYESFPNIWAVGIAHGMLGALAYYLVLGLDPGAEMVNAVSHLLR